MPPVPVLKATRVPSGEMATRSLKLAERNSPSGVGIANRVRLRGIAPRYLLIAKMPVAAAPAAAPANALMAVRRVIRAGFCKSACAGLDSASSSSRRASPMSRNRRLGSFSRQSRSRRRTCGDAAAGSFVQSGSRSRIAAIVSDDVSPANALRRVNIS